MVFLLPALSYYDLTTYCPWRVPLAVRSKAKVVLPQSPPVELHYLRPQYYGLGVITLDLPAGRIRIYDREKIQETLGRRATPVDSERAVLSRHFGEDPDKLKQWSAQRAMSR